jgi:uracil-DNA glycosylase
MSSLKQFVHVLSKEPCRELPVVNMYAYPGVCGTNSRKLHRANRLRRENLLTYLNYFTRHRAEVMLVGEAPGKNGCRKTGIPFLSEALLLEGLQEKQDRFPAELEWTFPNEAYGRPVRKEPSSTILWNTLQANRLFPLIWNAFPFHPHQPEKPDTNRKPSWPEQHLGLEYLAKLINLLQPLQVVAVGRVAAASLKVSGIHHTYVRHPARGGKTAFEKGIAGILGK